jgi:hypothetical protein
VDGNDLHVAGGRIGTSYQEDSGLVFSDGSHCAMLVAPMPKD